MLYRALRLVDWLEFIIASRIDVFSLKVWTFDTDSFDLTIVALKFMVGGCKL